MKVIKNKSYKKYKKKYNRYTRKKLKDGNILQINVEKTIKKYIKNLITNIDTCDISMNNCFIPNSKSGNIIYICNKYVFKIPPKNYKQKIIVKNNSIILDNNSMNLLIQNIVKNLLKNKNKNKNIQIEHYDKLCKYNDNYALMGKKFNYKHTKKDIIDKNKKILSIEDYLIYLSNININDKIYKKKQIKKQTNKIYRWIQQLFNELDYLFNYIQFHHVDPKAAQLFINNNDIVLGDLDKVTFTLNIGNNPYRVTLGSKVDNILYKMSNRSNPEIMRTEYMPLSSNTYEKACFLSSILLVLGNGEFVNNIRNNLINKIKINYSNIYNILILKNINNYINKSLNFRKKHRTASECVLYNSVNLNTKYNIPLCDDNENVNENENKKNNK